MTASTIEMALGGYEPPNGTFSIGVVDHRGCGGSAVFPLDQAAVVFTDLDNTKARAKVPMDLAKAYYEQKKRLLNAAIEECAAVGGDALAQKLKETDYSLEDLRDETAVQIDGARPDPPSSTPTALSVPRALPMVNFCSAWKTNPGSRLAAATGTKSSI